MISRFIHSVKMIKCSFIMRLPESVRGRSYNVKCVVSVKNLFFFQFRVVVVVYSKRQLTVGRLTGKSSSTNLLIKEEVLMPCWRQVPVGCDIWNNSLMFKVHVNVKFGNVSLLGFIQCADAHASSKFLHLPLQKRRLRSKLQIWRIHVRQILIMVHLKI